ncbi:VTT domain-containing protein [Bacillus sp. 31A1R]|uniref:TVP38/TMEM64 family membrane protein n=1 Tax=Robertmurraya mangrovi TaxID=3098077 RepID=A0ABU5J2X3_9BACI|nr:VTT domain-containing protein [Bacillus sp. 31A1R]MDZ5473773.1 VTT domain-containing protein [Bacillus sp. 31A1R]
MKTWFVLFFYFVLLMVGFYYRDPLLVWIQTSDNTQLPLMFFLSVLFSTLPIVPFTLFGGLMGVKYGLALGVTINWFGNVTAAAIYYVMARYAFSNYFEKKMNKFKKMGEFNEFLRERAFIAIIVGRLIPVIPPLVVNVYSALNSIPFFTFILATFIGSIPPMFMLAFGGNQLLENVQTFVLGIIFYVLFLVVVISGCRIWFKLFHYVKD